MPINPALALQVKGFELPDPMAQMAQATQIQNALQQQRMGDIQMQNALRQQQQQRKYESIVAGFAPNMPIGERVRALQTQGLASQAAQLAKTESELSEQQRKEALAGVNLANAKAEIVARYFPNVEDQNSYSQARLRAIATGQVKPTELPEQYDKSFVDALLKAGVSLKDQIANVFREREVGARVTSAEAAATQARVAEQKAQRDRVPMSVQEFEAYSRMPPEQQAAFTAFRASQRPTTTIQMPPGESAFAQKIGAGLGAQVVGDIDAARNAPNVAARANSVLAAINENKAFMGPAADFKLQLARALNVSGKGPSEQIAATETLIADLKRSVIAAIKASNLGTGNGFTNKDLDYLVNAEAADIAKDPRTLQEFAERAYKTAQEAAKKGNARLSQNEQIRQQAGVEKFEVPEMVTVSRRSSVRRGAAPSMTPDALNIPKAYTGDPALWQYMSPEDRALWKD